MIGVLLVLVVSLAILALLTFAITEEVNHPCC